MHKLIKCIFGMQFLHLDLLWIMPKCKSDVILMTLNRSLNSVLFSINETNIIALSLFIPDCLVMKYGWLMFIFPLRLLFALYSLLGNITSPLEMYL